MINTKYTDAYKEVLCVINNLNKEDYEKIPNEYIEFLQENCNNEYDFRYDTSKSFKEQALRDDTKYILFGLFEKYGTTDIQKTKIKSYKANYINKLEEQKKEKYNPNNVFNNKNEKITKENLTTTDMVEYKENIFKRIILKIKSFFTNK